ncbi:MAG: class I SAM-dependent methyltransferase [Candidatus Roizmanbacteria bacterium]|nr:class I SAM-dependent methyltransferase [Candidatus Roizmanbacteria bacterium]
MSSEILVNDTSQWHIEQKQATMDEELSASYVLRGMNGNSELIIGDGAYPDALGRAVSQLHNSTRTRGPIVNVGDGLGFNGPGIQRALPLSMLINLDLSPRLIEAQKERDPNRSIIQADATRFPFADCSLEGVVANEIISDFLTYSFRTNQLLAIINLIESHRIFPKNSIFSPEELRTVSDLIATTKQPSGVWTELIRIYQAYDLPIPIDEKERKTTSVNVGAIRFLEELERTLKPGGWAWISEWGSSNDPSYTPNELELEGHSEYGISFDTLSQVGQMLGFDVEVVPLVKEIGVDLDQLYTCHHSEEHDGALFLSRNEALTMFPEEFEAHEDDFQHLGSTDYFFYTFHVLKLKKRTSLPKAMRE